MYPTGARQPPNDARQPPCTPPVHASPMHPTGARQSNAPHRCTSAPCTPPVHVSPMHPAGAPHTAVLQLGLCAQYRSVAQVLLSRGRVLREQPRGGVQPVHVRWQRVPAQPLRDLPVQALRGLESRRVPSPREHA
eukprot:gene4682-biopygen6982